MRIVEIVALENGAHRNQNGNFSSVPKGWAVVPEDLETPNFPFGTFVTEEVHGVRTVANWTPGIMPEVTEPETPVTEVEQLRADLDYIAIMTGVDL